MQTDKKDMVLKNNYYVGKRLSAENMLMEQKYYETMRMLHNKAFYGKGIVKGLELELAGEAAVCIKSGIAIDGLGRELIVAKPFKLSLAEIEESGCRENGIVDLVLEYEEVDKGPEYKQVGCIVKCVDVQDMETDDGTLAGVYIGRVSYACIAGKIHILSADNTNRIFCELPWKPEAYCEWIRDKRLYPQPEVKMSVGEVRMDIPSTYRNGDTLVSEEIEHGFGNVEVYVLISKEEKRGYDYVDTGRRIYGNEDLFCEHSGGAAISESAIRINKHRGVFQIGIRLKEPVNAVFLYLHWIALKLG